MTVEPPFKRDAEKETWACPLPGVATADVGADGMPRMVYVYEVVLPRVEEDGDERPIVTVRADVEATLKIERLNDVDVAPAATVAVPEAREKSMPFAAVLVVTI